MQREPKKTDTLEVRISTEKKSAFMAVCLANRTSASATLREFIDRYLRTQSQAHPSWKEELRMLSKGQSSRRTTIAGGIATLAAGAATMLSAPALASTDARLVAAFEFMDANRDGSITAAEFETAHEKSPPLGAVALLIETRTRPANETRRQLFDRLDADSNGSVSQSELKRAAQVRTVASADILAADGDGDGLLSAGELAAYVTARKAGAGFADPASGAGAFAHAIVAEHDRDGDSRLSLAEIEPH